MGVLLCVVLIISLTTSIAGSVDQMKKCAELAIYQAVILNGQRTQLLGTVQRQDRKREAPRPSTILTGARRSALYITSKRNGLCREPADSSSVYIPRSVDNRSLQLEKINCLHGSPVATVSD
ncbi:hypothetical protein V1508DRAFT_288212 [Lipomyces doorenjongii]|uniref:uncharacterized protein n=1 Tax=Lipomyces doorenjongii TaxID=383834 RepID=UPI0034CE3DB5